MASYWSDDDCVLAGVIDTDNIVNASVIPNVFSNKNFSCGHQGYNGFFNSSRPDIVMHFGVRQYSRLFAIDQIDEVNLSILRGAVVLTADGICSSNDDISLADNEIIITYELFEELFNANSKWYYINSDLDKVLSTPSEIGQTFSLKFYSYDNDELITNCGEVKIKGIFFEKGTPSERDKTRIITSSNTQYQFCRELSPSTVLIQTSSIKNLGSFTTMFRRDYLGVITDAGRVETTAPTPQGDNFKSISEECYAFEQTIMLVSTLFFAVGATLLIVLVLLVINLISFSISNRKKEIGILSAIGTSNRDVTSIFLLETSIVAAISFVLILVLALVSLSVLNVLLSQSESLSVTIPFLRFGVLSAAILIVSSFGLMLLSALIPIRKIIKLKPIDAIRNI